MGSVPDRWMKQETTTMVQSLFRLRLLSLDWIDITAHARASLVDQLAFLVMFFVDLDVSGMRN